MLPTRDLSTPTGPLPLTILGFGGAPLGNMYTAISDADAGATLDAPGSGDCGCSTRRLNTASGCRRSGLDALLRARPRRDYVLSTKVGRLLA